MLRCVSLCALSVLLSPAMAQSPRPAKNRSEPAAQEMRTRFEFGLRATTNQRLQAIGDDLLASISGLIPKQDTDLLRRIKEIVRKSLPVRIQVGATDGVKDSVSIADSSQRWPFKELRGELSRMFGTSVLDERRVEEKESEGRHRVFWSTLKDAKTRAKLAGVTDLPAPKGVGGALLERLREASCHIYLDATGLGVGDPDNVRVLGKNGLQFGVAVHDGEGKRVAVDFGLGVRRGDGILGLMLPRKPGDAQPIGSMRKHDFVVACDLGTDVLRTVETFLSISKATGKTTRADANDMLELADSADGRMTIYGRLVDGRVCSVVVVGLDEDCEDDALLRVRRLVSRMPAGTPSDSTAGGSAAKRVEQQPTKVKLEAENGVYYSTNRNPHLAAASQPGLLVVAFGASRKQTKELVSEVLAGGESPAPAQFRSTKAPVKALVNPAAAKWLFRRQSVEAKDAAERAGNAFGRKLMNGLPGDVAYAMS